MKKNISKHFIKKNLKKQNTFLTTMGYNAGCITPYSVTPTNVGESAINRKYL